MNRLRSFDDCKFFWNNSFRSFLKRSRCFFKSSIRLILFVLSKVSQNRADDLERELINLFSSARENKAVNEMIDQHVVFDVGV